jgi:hypothetical protein
MGTGAKAVAWLGGAIVFIMVLAAWSRVSQMKEPGKLIDGASSAVANLFKGVLK